MELADWHAGGKRIPVRTADGVRLELFVRVEGQGPWTTFVHGFPTSSWDWAPLLDPLPEGRSRVFVDLLGFGDSDKPRGHDFSLHEQLELMQQVWSKLDVDRTVLVAHDLGDSVVQEALARIREGSWEGPEIASVVLLNGGLFYRRIEPMPVQQLLRSRLLGWLVVRLIRRRGFERAMRRLFSKEHPVSDDTLDAMWDAIERRGGRHVMHRIARYLDERADHELRWTQALAEAPVAVRYLWGLQDPVSGPAMREGIEEVVEDPDVVAWDDVGHYPQVEVPARVAGEIASVEAG